MAFHGKPIVAHRIAPFVWPQFILAAALERVAKRFDPGKENNPFCYADTHAGPGRIPIELATAPYFPDTANQIYWATIAGQKFPGHHPGSWVTASRVLGDIFSSDDGFEIDVNDIDPQALEQAKTHHESGRLRLWSHDWFKFLRDRLSMSRPPHFVFIDPPPDDPRGPDFAINAALLLDTVKCPYLMTYNQPVPQYVINLIGRTAVELHTGSNCTGVILGGGAESILLSLLPDLGKIAVGLDGTFAIQSPSNDDYII